VIHCILFIVTFAAKPLPHLIDACMKSTSLAIAFIAILAVLTVSPHFVYSQVRGTTTSVSKDLSFQKELKNVNLDPNPLTGGGSRVDFIQKFENSKSLNNVNEGVINDILDFAGISIPGWVFDLTGGVEFFCSGMTPTFNASASLDAGGYYETHSVGNSNIGINYPVGVSVTFPQANTFACGEIIKLQTSYSVINPESTDKIKVNSTFI